MENKAAYLVTGVDADGFKHVLGIWLATSEVAVLGGVLAELRNRGIRDGPFARAATALTACLTRSRATWPKGEGEEAP